MEPELIWVGLVGIGALLAGCSDEVTPRDATTDIPPDAQVEVGADGQIDVCGLTRPQWGAGGELMLPGSDCLQCHREGGRARSVFSVAGTVFATGTCPVGLPNAVVRVVDEANTTEVLRTNEQGNFFTRTALRPPFRVSLDIGGSVQMMNALALTGACGSCHGPGREPYLAPSP